MSHKEVCLFCSSSLGFVTCRRPFLLEGNGVEGYCNWTCNDASQGCFKGHFWKFILQFWLKPMALPSFALFADIRSHMYSLYWQSLCASCHGTHPLELGQDRNFPCENTLSSLAFHTLLNERTETWLSGLDTLFRVKKLLILTLPKKSFICQTISSFAKNLIIKLVNSMQTVLLICKGVLSSSLEQHWWAQCLPSHTQSLPKCIKA